MKKLNKRNLKIGAMAALVLLLGGLLVWNLQFDPYKGTVKELSASAPLDGAITSEAAVEDLDFMISRLKERHPAAIYGLPGDLEKLWQSERAKLSAKKTVTVLELWQSSARVLATLKDGHTGVRHLSDTYRVIPVEFTDKSNQLTAASEEFSEAAVASIGGIPSAELYQRFKDQFSSELDAYTRYSFLRYLNRQDYLAFLGVQTNEGIRMEVAAENGSQNYDYSFGPEENRPQQETKFVFYTIDEALSVGYFTLLKCQYNETYRNTLKAFFTAVKEKGIRSVVVDLRDNPGGNSMVSNEFVRYLPIKEYQTGSSHVRYGPLLIKNKSEAKKNQNFEELLFPGDVYILTSTYTFSSAVDFAVLIQDNDLGMVVGESPGNMPTSYGDILTFQTPNTKLYFSVSFKHFIRPDASKSESPLLPDVLVDAEQALEKTNALVKTKAQVP